MTRSRRLLLKVTTALLATLVAAMLSEVLLRAVYISSELYRGYQWLVRTHLVEMPYRDFVHRQERIEAVRAKLGMERGRSHPVFGWIYNPTFAIDIPEEDDGLYLALQIRINSHGLRGEEFPEKKPPGEVRIIALGGSTTACEEVREGETYPAQLQAILRQRCPGRSVRVINAGIPTYDTRGSWLLYALRLFEFEPDFVTIYQGVNDVMSNASGGLEVLPKLNFNGQAITPFVYQGDAAPLSPVREVVDDVEALFKRSLLVTVAHDLLSTWRGSGCPAVAAPDRAGIEKFTEYYRALVRQIRASGATPVPVTHAISYPGHFEPADRKKVAASCLTFLHDGTPEVVRQIVDLENRSVVELSRQEGLAVCDVAAAVPPDRAHFFDFCHLTAEGNRSVAETLALTLVPLIDRLPAHQ
jgi:lysophospholipase L1-like esterase